MILLRSYSHFLIPDLRERPAIEIGPAKKVKDLRWKDQGETSANICQKTLLTSNSAQLFNLFKAGHLNADNGKKQQKMAHCHKRK